MEVDTSVDVSLRGESLAAWVKSVVDELGKPVLERVDLEFADRRHRIGLAGARRGSTRLQTWSTGTRGWNAALSLLRRGDLRLFQFEVSGGAPTLPVLIGIDDLDANNARLGFDRWNDLAGQGVRVRSLLGVALLGFPLPANYHENVVAAFHRLVSEMSPDQGFISVDEPLDETRYERDHGISPVTGRRHRKDALRGAFWATQISAEHIEHLGGIDRIRRDAPVHRVDIIDAEHIVLQLSPRIDEYTPEELRDLRDYLRPALQKPRDTFPTGDAVQDTTS